MTTLALNPIPTESAAKTAASVKPAAATTALDIVVRAIDSMPDDMVQLTTIYLKLRTAKEDLDRQVKARKAPIEQAIDRLESHFLARMNDLQVDSLKNAAGTPYKSERSSVTVADVSAFVDFVMTRALQALPVAEAARAAIKKAILESGQLSLLEARASKSAVDALVEETGVLPAGLNRRVETKVNVRSSD